MKKKSKKQSRYSLTSQLSPGIYTDLQSRNGTTFYSCITYKNF